MSVTVVLDLVEGSSYEHTRQGRKATRTALVSGLTGDPDAILYLAETATGMPAYNAAHPTIPGLYLKGIYPEAVGGGQAKVRLVYEPPKFTPTEEEGAAVVVGATVEQQSTYEDIDNVVLQVQYTSGGVTRYQTPTVSVLRPKASLEFTRREDAGVLATSKAYVGKVNLAGWAVDAGAAARTWLCTGIVARSADGGDTYDVTYSFLYRDDPPTGNWDAFVQYMDPQTGRAPYNLDADGRKAYVVYETADFDDLDLP